MLGLHKSFTKEDKLHDYEQFTKLKSDQELVSNTKIRNICYLSMLLLSVKYHLNATIMYEFY